MTDRHVDTALVKQPQLVGWAPPATDEAERFKIAERQWQDEVGHALLDKPYETPGSAAIFNRQSDRLIRLLSSVKPGAIVEIGCGKGHFLKRLSDSTHGRGRLLCGVDISRAVFSLPPQALAGAQADGAALPFRAASVAAVVYDGSLHHVIDYPAALREAIRVLLPGGTLVLFEPVSSRFSQLVHRLLDPIIFRTAVYESPIDIHYKHAFHEDVILRTLGEYNMAVQRSRSDFLAYPFTGCYAGSIFTRSEWFMRLLVTLEDVIAAIPLLNRMAQMLAWRFTIVATKPAA